MQRDNLISDKIFQNETVDLNGKVFVRCVFYRCNIRGVPLDGTHNLVYYECDRSVMTTDTRGYGNTDGNVPWNDSRLHGGMTAEEVQDFMVNTSHADEPAIR